MEASFGGEDPQILFRKKAGQEDEVHMGNKNRVAEIAVCKILFIPQLLAFYFIRPRQTGWISLPSLGTFLTLWGVERHSIQEHDPEVHMHVVNLPSFMTYGKYSCF